jgi:hypothetical protein
MKFTKRFFKRTQLRFKDTRSIFIYALIRRASIAIAYDYQKYISNVHHLKVVMENCGKTGFMDKIGEMSRHKV